MTLTAGHHYRAFGLSIVSELRLPELDATSTGSEIQIRFGKIETRREERSGRECTFATESEAYFAWKNAGRFLVRDGREIIVDAAADASEDVVRSQLLGPVLAMALHQRGLLVLHGSAVAASSSALVFLGVSGSGKSTTAAALNTRGYALLADDIIALDVTSSEEPRILPGLSATNLWSDSAQSTGFMGASERIIDRPSKRAFRRGPIAATEAVALGSVYALGIAEEPACESLEPLNALVEVFNHSFGPELLEFGLGKSIFEQCAGLIKTIPVKRLSRTRSFAQLSRLIELIENEIKYLDSSDAN